jgi:hypothetical protein
MSEDMSPQLSALLRALADWLYSITEPEPTPDVPFDSDAMFDGLEGFDG